ncbi:MAG: hypothetical protein ACKO2Z_35910, partial [Sphaerospermopsis kisseleviana]
MDLESIDYRESLVRKKEGYHATIRNTEGAIKQSPGLKDLITQELTKNMPASASKAIAEIRLLQDQVRRAAALEYAEARFALKEIEKNLETMVKNFKDDKKASEANRVFGLEIQDSRSGVDILQKTLEQRRLLQTLDPLDDIANQLAEFESSIASVNNEIQLNEKIQAINELERTNQITRNMAKERRLLAE